MSDFEVSDPSDLVEPAPTAPLVPPVYVPGTACATIYIDGTDVTTCCLSGASTRRLNRPSQATVKLPMDCAIGGVGSLLKIYFGGSLHHHGRVMLCETDTGEDTGYTTYNSMDPMEMWQWRPVRDADGDFSNPTIISDFVTGPEILEAMLDNSENAGAGPPTDAEGTLFLSMGTFETGGADLSGAPTDWPMSIGELTSLLVSTGCLDVVITPTDPGGGVMGTVDAYNGDFGTDLSGSVVFQYGTGAHNISRLRWNQDMQNMSNKIWYFMGPRIQTPADPQGDQHWCYNVTGDDPGMLILDPIPNGASVAAMIARRDASRTTYGVRMDIQIFDAGECTPDDPADCCDPTGDPLTALYRELYRRRWQSETWIRADPRELIHVTPTGGTAIGSFDIGDLVGVEAVAAVRGGFSGAQRVYEYTIGWDDDGVCQLSELQTSPTADQ